MMRRAFTLVELLVYLAIVSVLLVMVFSLFSSLTRARVRQQAIAEVEQQGYIAMTQITQAIRNAKFVSEPAPGALGQSLVLATYSPTSSTTTFILDGDALYSIDATGTLPITNTQVLVRNVTFQNLAASTTNGSIKIQFTVYHATTSRYETNYSATFYGSASVRNQL